MKKVFLPLAFLIIGVGLSYFAFNHSIVNKKIQFNDEIDLLFDQNLSAEELNGKIFQLLFAYFAIDLRDIEKRVTTKIQDSIKAPEPEVIEKVVEKIVYLPAKKVVKVDGPKAPEIPEKKIVQFRNLKSFEKVDLREFLKASTPILVRDKAFESLNGTHKYVGHNTQGPNFEIEMENLFKLENKAYKGTSKIDYLVLGKSEDAIAVDGMPLNFLKNSLYPTLVVARISKDRFLLINTADEFYTNDIKGILYLRKGENFKRDGYLRVKSKN